MENRQARTLESLERIVDFLSRTPIKPEPPLLRRTRLALERTTDRLSDLASEQSPMLSGMSGAQMRHLRTTIRRDRLMPLVRIVKPMLEFAPDSEKLLTVPHARTDTLTLARHAQQVASFLASHRRLLVSAGYSRTFVEDFKAEADRLANAASYVGKARDRRSHATLEIKRELAEAKRCVTIIDGLMMLHCANQAHLIGAYRNARRVKAKQGRPTDRVRANRSAREAAEVQ